MMIGIWWTHISKFGHLYWSPDWGFWRMLEVSDLGFHILKIIWIYHWVLIIIFFWFCSVNIYLKVKKHLWPSSYDWSGFFILLIIRYGHMSLINCGCELWLSILISKEQKTYMSCKSWNLMTILLILDGQESYCEVHVAEQKL